MRIKVFTLFPDMIRPMLGESILGRAISAGRLTVDVIDIRQYTTNKHNNADDYPFGGGAGMVMMAQPVVDAMEQNASPGARRILLSPRGRRFDQRVAEELSKEAELHLLCGHYEGIDQRAIDLVIDEELSIGDYVLTGGELGALVVIDAVSRLLPGVLGSDLSAEDESFSAGDGPASGLLEYPQYTRPSEFRGLTVPEALLNGNHEDIQRYRRAEALYVTRKSRPDLLETANLSNADKLTLRGFDALDAFLEKTGVVGPRMDAVEARAWERAFIEAFVPAENQKKARKLCLGGRDSKGGLEQAFLRGLIPCRPEEESSWRIAFFPACRTGFISDGEINVSAVPTGEWTLLVDDMQTKALLLGERGRYFCGVV